MGKRARRTDHRSRPFKPRSVGRKTAALFGRNVRRVRRSLGMAIGELARLVEDTPEFIQSIERGEIDAHLGDMEAIAKALGVDIAELVR